MCELKTGAGEGARFYFSIEIDQSKRPAACASMV